MPMDDKTVEVSTSSDAPIELESQFILRLPSVAAASLKAAVQAGVTNLKDRLSIQLQPDMRHGTVRFDGWVLPAKVVDLPCIIESHKTLDKKNFYKTADICQMMICKEESEENKIEEEEGKKGKDGKDKKFIWPHGITPPLKNVRKKRFRKTLKKKYVDFPEIEKEVKRLFRQDNEAIQVRYEVVNADDEMKNDSKTNINSPATGGNSGTGFDVGEHDIFGDVVSSSDEEDTRVPDSDDGSRLSITNTSNREIILKESRTEKLVTEFSKGMITSTENDSMNEFKNSESSFSNYEMETNNAAAAVAALAEDTEASTALARGAENEELRQKLNEIENEIENLQRQRRAQEMDMQGIENIALKQRFQQIIDDLKEQEAAKVQEYEEISKYMNDMM